ncbi:hypothetical protein ABLE92_11735 [Gordonia sp. VNQ95]|jgi:hypothetical protein
MIGDATRYAAQMHGIEALVDRTRPRLYDTANGAGLYADAHTATNQI